jgi:hypothetical protein
MEVITEKRLAAKVDRGGGLEEEMVVERAFETGRMGRKTMAHVYEILLPRLRRVLSGPAVSTSTSDFASKVKESC